MLEEVQVYYANMFSAMDLQSAFSPYHWIKKFCRLRKKCWQTEKNLNVRYSYDKLATGCRNNSTVMNKAMKINFKGLSFVKNIL